jgi:outer membrane murein-binding lipoprotein Lpp
LKARIDDLEAEIFSLRAKADGLANEVTQLKADSTKAQELANKHRMEAELKEKDLHQCFQTALDSLHGKLCSPYSM